MQHLRHLTGKIYSTAEMKMNVQRLKDELASVLITAVEGSPELGIVVDLPS
jgi:hypothetical protein